MVKIREGAPLCPSRNALEDDREARGEPAHAEEAIFQATQGVPRRVNAVAHHTLIAAALAKAKSASVDHVQAALPEVA